MNGAMIQTVSAQIEFHILSNYESRMKIEGIICQVYVHTQNSDGPWITFRDYWRECCIKMKKLLQ
jgi:hypothetical protein